MKYIVNTTNLSSLLKRVNWSLKKSKFNVIEVFLEYKIEYMGLEIKVRLDDKQGDSWWGDFDEEHQEVAEIFEERLEKTFGLRWKFYDYHDNQLIFKQII